ncbi:hypothetical protein GGF41_003538 [Coemansia sp. RSA 2531]|nr:hypothetical protein GGF41_003538 [Coemansia sp. RSA 2531]
MLSSERVFESKRRALRHVIVNESVGHRNVSQVPEANMSKFLSNLLSYAHRLVLEPLALLTMPMVAMKCGHGFHTITIFETCSKSLLLFDVLGLLKALPALIELRSSINGLGPELESISADDLPDHVFSTYFEAGKNLQIWRMDSDGSVTIDYVLLLALVCPKLWRIQLKPGALRGSRAKITEALSSHIYSKYAPQLNMIPSTMRE